MTRNRSNNRRSHLSRSRMARQPAASSMLLMLCVALLFAGCSRGYYCRDGKIYQTSRLHLGLLQVEKHERYHQCDRCFQNGANDQQHPVYGMSDTDLVPRVAAKVSASSDRTYSVQNGNGMYAPAISAESIESSSMLVKSPDLPESLQDSQSIEQSPLMNHAEIAQRQQQESSRRTQVETTATPLTAVTLPALSIPFQAQSNDIAEGLSQPDGLQTSDPAAATKSVWTPLREKCKPEQDEEAVSESGKVFPLSSLAEVSTRVRDYTLESLLPLKAIADKYRERGPLERLASLSPPSVLSHSLVETDEMPHAVTLQPALAQNAEPLIRLRAVPALKATPPLPSIAEFRSLPLVVESNQADSLIELPKQEATGHLFESWR